MPDGSALSTVPVMIALVFMTVSLYTDLRCQRIPNLITGPVACGGILFHCATAGLLGGGLYALKGLILGCLFLLIPFVLGGMGGGDVKCLGALGAWLGPERIFWIFLYGAIAGGVLAFFLLIRSTGGGGFRGVFLSLKTGFFTGRLSETTARNIRFPYTIPIAAGFIVFILIGKAVP